MDYAYLDKYKMLHVVDDKATADKYTSGKVVETSLPNDGGYFTNDKGEHLRVDVDDKSYRVSKTHVTEDEFKKAYPAVWDVIESLK